MEAFTKLGGKSRPVDKRDFQGSVAPSTHDAVFLQKEAFLAPIYNQAKTPSCGAHAGTWLSIFLQKINSCTPRFTWIDIKANGADKNPDDGTDMRSIFQSLQKTGVDDFEPLGNDSSLPNAQYADASVVTQPMHDNAQTHLIDSYQFHDATTFDNLKQLIQDKDATIVLMRVGATMWTAKDGTISWAEKDVLPLRAPNPVVDGHFVTCHSFAEITELELGGLEAGILSLGHIIQKYDPELYNDMGLSVETSKIQKAILTSPSPKTSGIVIFANSWSATWGFQGHGYFSEDYMPFVLEVGTATKNPPVAPVRLVEPSTVVNTPTVPTTTETVPVPKKLSTYQRFWAWILSLFSSIIRTYGKHNKLP